MEEALNVVRFYEQTLISMIVCFETKKDNKLMVELQTNTVTFEIVFGCYSLQHVL